MNITTNKNAVPYDTNKPGIASGIRIGTPALTTRGFGKAEFEELGNCIADTLEKPEDSTTQSNVSGRVKELCDKFPMGAFRLD